LYASALALAVTVFVVLPQILARKVGNPVLWTVTVIRGFLGSVKSQLIAVTAAACPAT
jgi:hypothetical protein